MCDTERGRWWARNIISDAIREAENKGFKKTDMAEATGRSLSTINNLAIGSEAVPSLPTLIILTEEFRLESVAKAFCKMAGGMFIKSPSGKIDEKAILKKYSQVLREEGEDADKIAALSDGSGTEKERERAIQDLTETMQEIAGLIEMLKLKSERR